MKYFLTAIFFLSLNVLSESEDFSFDLNKALSEAVEKHERLYDVRKKMLLNKQMEFSSDDIHLVCDKSYILFPDMEFRELYTIDTNLKGALKFDYHFSKIKTRLTPIDIQISPKFYSLSLVTGSITINKIDRTTLKMDSGLQCEKVSISKYKDELAKFKNWIKEQQDKRKI